MEGITSPPVAQNSSFLSPLLLSLIGIVGTSLAIIVYHFFIVKYCQRNNQADPTAAEPPQVPASGGVEKRVLDTIPIFVFSSLKGHRFRSGQEECVVCLGELCDEEMVRFLPSCRHAFHVRCIDEWFLAHTSCPLCRTPIQKNDRQLSLVISRTASLGESSGGMLRHSTSLGLPPPGGRKPRGLKRSVSLDQSSIVINIQSGSERVNLWRTSSCEIKLKTSSDWNRTRSSQQLERVSSRLLRSFSRLRGAEKGSAIPILPY